MIGLTGSLDCVPIVHLLPFLGFSWPRWQRLLLVPFLFHCDISSGFKRVAWFPPLPSVFYVSFVIPRSRYFCCHRANVLSLFEKPPKVRWENHVLCLLVPAAKLFTNSARQAISRGVKSVNDKLLISTELRDELPHGGFLGSWGRFLPWKSARHIHLILHSDASFCGWGGRLTPWASAANLSQWKKLRPSSTLLKVFCSILIMPGLMPLSTTRSCCTAGNGKSRGPLQIQISWNPSSPSRWGGTSP